MATVTSTLKLNDQMTRVLNGINRAMSSTLRAMEHTDAASSAAFKTAKKDVALATKYVEEFGEAFSNVPDPVNRSKSSVEDLLKKTISLTAIAYGVKKAFDTWGQITDISDKVSLTRGGLEMLDYKSAYGELAAFEDAIMQSANRSRSYYIDTAEAVGQIGLNAKQAFLDANGALNTKELVAFSELINKSFKVSRTDTQAQAGAMRQLTQALASGVLRGDEFNSIAENAPMIKQVVEDYVNAMGMNPEGLSIRDLASDGLLTADIIKQAMFMASDDIESKFATLPKTWAENWTLMKNDALESFNPVFDRISQMANSEGFEEFAVKAVHFMNVAADYALQFIDVMGKVAAFTVRNGDTIALVLATIVAGLVVLKAEAMATGITAMIAWFSATWPILLIIGLIAALIIAYQNTEGALQILIAVIGMVVLAIGAWVAIQWVLNVALTANPIGAVIMAIVILIGVVIAIIAWVRNLWKTNLDFKYGVLNIWDSIIHFFKGVPLFFTKVGYGIADAFSYAKITVLSLMQAMANGTIDIINNLINLLNKIPGVALPAFKHMEFTATAAAEEEAKKQARATDIANQQAVLDAERAAQQATRDAQRAVDQAALDAKSAAEEAAKNDLSSKAANGIDYSEFGGAGMGGAGNMGDIGRVGSVGKIEDDITISEEDIKLLKDITSMEYQVNYTQMTPTAQFGDTYITKEADAEEMLDKITGFVGEAMQSQLVLG